MQKIKYYVKTLSPILFSKESGDRNMTETFDYIPGRVILGIFASKYIKKEKLGNNAHENIMFKDLFLKDKLNFNNAYIKMEDEKTFYPTPFSIQVEKNNEDSVHDLLFKDTYDEYAQTKYLGGYSSINENYVKNESVNKSLNFHHSRDEKTGASKDGIIFNYESINKDQLFEGYIVGEDTLIKYLYENFEKEFVAYTGRSKTSQYGKIQFEFVSDPTELNPELKIQSNISLTFLSEVLLYNDYGNSVCNKESLEKYLQEIVSNDIRITKSFIKPTRVDNYVSIWKLKKPSEICYSAGSCFMIDNVKENDLEKIKELELKGIGERRNEGFGRIVFGIQNDKNLTDISSKEKEVFSKPINEIPQIAKDFIKAAINDIIVREIKTKAITDARDFNNKNKGKITKSLLGRLESFVKGSIDFNNFKGKLDKDILRKPAKDQLENCIIEGKTFYDYLTETNIQVVDILKSKNLNALSDELLNNIYKPSEDIDINKVLYKMYYLTFFAFLRKLIKKSDVSGKKENNNE